MAEAWRSCASVAPARTVNCPAGLKTGETLVPCAGGAPPSKFQWIASPPPVAMKLANSPALIWLGPLVMLVPGSARVSVATCEVMRPSTQAEKGRNSTVGIGLPFSVTTSVPVSMLQEASSRTLSVLEVKVSPSAGVGPMKRSGPGAGRACAFPSTRKSPPRKMEAQSRRLRPASIRSPRDCLTSPPRDIEPLRGLIRYGWKRRSQIVSRLRRRSVKRFPQCLRPLPARQVRTMLRSA